MSLPPPELERLSTPVAWLDPEGRLDGANSAFASWLGVSARRLQGLALAELDLEATRLAEVLARLPEGGEAVRVHRARLAFPGGDERFAELWLSTLEPGGAKTPRAAEHPPGARARAPACRRRSGLGDQAGARLRPEPASGRRRRR